MRLSVVRRPTFTKGQRSEKGLTPDVRPQRAREEATRTSSIRADMCVRNTESPDPVDRAAEEDATQQQSFERA